jgi:hypothetical protein
MIIRATMGSVTKERFLEIWVPGLRELDPGANYVLTGFENRPQHPEGTNHFGTLGANNNLVAIANDYKAQFYGANPIPEAEKLRYNDQSLINGGKFDIPGNWCTTCHHNEHRIGINCDVSARNVPQSRWEALTRIFAFRGSPRYLDETNTSQPHWHLRFEGNMPSCP